MEPSTHCPSPRRLALYGLTAAILAAVGLLATSPMLPMVWDEGYMIRRADGIGRWVGRLRGTVPLHGGASPLSRAGIAADWAYTTQIEGHPAFSGILIAAGRRIAPSWMAPLQAARLGPILLFAMACGVLCYRLARDYSLVAAIAGTAAVLFIPRLFAHAHFATLDGPLTAAWILVWAAFVESRKRRWAIPLLGAALGVALATKITGWLTPVALVTWIALYRDRPAARALAFALPMAVVVFYVLNPPLWHAPVDGLLAFFRLNLHRAANPDLNVSTQFLGQMYDLDHTLPWYNTLFWTAITVPVPILLLAVAGLGIALRQARRQPWGLLIVAQWAVLIVVRALPGVPPHDGVRLFLPAFAMLAALAGVGGHALYRRLAARVGTRAACAVLVLPLIASGSGLYRYAPQWLSYYNVFIGGLRGATELGMEPTYYWDTLDRPVLDWLHAHTPENGKIRFAAPSWANLELMRRWGVLRRDYRDEAPGRFVWYVLQRRPSAASEADSWLIEHARPAYEKRLGPGWAEDVPLLWVYPHSQYLEAEKRTRSIGVVAQPPK
jgi:hypothetical protein